MHLLRIQIPNFRVLKDIDLAFEKEMIPKIFPVASLNGGGKSTLLQLIFALLHCSITPERLPYLKNMLDDYQVTNKKGKETLAKIDIIDGSQTYSIEFFCCNDAYITELLAESRTESGKLTFSALAQVKLLKSKLENLEKEMEPLKEDIEHLKKLEKIEDEEGKREYLSNSLLQWRLEGKQLESQEKEYEKKLTASQDLKEQIEKSDKISQVVLRHLKLQNLLYLANLGENDGETVCLLGQINEMETDAARGFLEKLSQKIFLAAPATQVYLFLPKDVRKLLLQKGSNSYYEYINKAKSHLPGFFTYDFFLAIDKFISYFLEARDKDFQEAQKEGEYGKHYKELSQFFTSLLANKRVILTQDFSGLVFQIKVNGDSIELSPEDLSHGELKRLCIYSWIKRDEIQEAIVLMDEIEIALHPDWQYKMISDLNEWGPTNQYILATHSFELCQPLTPAHVKEIEPKLLGRDRTQ